MFADLHQIKRDTAEVLKPPRRLTVPQAAEQYVVLDIPGGYSGKWRNDLPYYMIQPAECLTRRDVDSVIFVGAAQTGKTQALVDNWMAHTVTCDPSDMMIVQTAQDTARDYSKRRIDRLLHSSPALKERLKSGSQHDNVFDKQFRSGMILSLGHPSKNQLAGKAIGKMALTDYDRMPEDIDGEGNAFDLARKRTTTFMSRGMTLAESSPSKPIVDPMWKPKTLHEAPPTRGILGLYNNGSRHRFYAPCPHCGEYFMPPAGIEAMSIPQIDSGDVTELSQQAALICAVCGALITQAHERIFKKSGIWLADGQTIKNGVLSHVPHNRIQSFWLQGWFAAFQSWESIVRNYLNAYRHWQRTGDEEPLKGTVNTDQAAPYLYKAQQIEEVDTDALLARREVFERKTVPEGVRFLLACVDVQKNRFVVQVIGFGMGLESWLIDRYNLKHAKRKDNDGKELDVSPDSYIEDWLLLTDEILKRSYPLADGSGREMSILVMAVDSGGAKSFSTGRSVTQNAYDYWRILKQQGLHRKVALVKGRPTGDRCQISYPDSSQRKDRHAGSKGDVPVYLLNVNSLKDTVAANLDRTERGHGYMHLPEWVGGWFIGELTAETRTAKGWENPTAKRNEAFDLYAYALGICTTLGADRILWDNPPDYAKPWDDNPYVSELETAQPHTENRKTLADIMRKLNS